MDIRILLEVLYQTKSVQIYRAPWKGKAGMGSRQNGSYYSYLEDAVFSSRQPKSENTCVIAGETDLYEVLQKILLNYNPRSPCSKMQES